MHTLFRIILLTSLLVALSACGQKGPIEIIPSERTEAEIVEDIEESVDTKTTQTETPEVIR